jgi:tetratricopeptide (TPR) repeat protein
MSSPRSPASQAPLGTVDAALAHARRLLPQSPSLAARQSQEILRVAPGHPSALLVLAVAEEAGAAEDGDRELRVRVARDERLAEGWLALADYLHERGETARADAAYAHHIRASTRDPRLLAPAAALAANRIPEAEHLLKAHLKAQPTDVAAIRMLAEVAARIGRYVDAEHLLERCLELAPGFAAARHHYAIVLFRQAKGEAALAEIERLLAEEPDDPSYRSLKAAILARLGDFEPSIALYERLLREVPAQPKLWMSYGHALKTVGRRADGEAAYRRGVELQPSFGEAWWSLANLKTFRFDDADVATMAREAAAPGASEDDRLHLEFALGKACEDREDWAASFRHYAEGNRIRRGQIEYDAAESAAHVERSKATLTREFFAARTGVGCPAPDPIFVLGMPRAGSTLVEQILSSHPRVEGTQELPDVIALARSLRRGDAPGEGVRYLDRLASLDPDRLRALGEEYLARTRIQRRTDRPFFIDKMPQNFAHVGLIHLMLPNAKIVDARRHPMQCCFSVFKQHFARGQHFSYDLVELGRYYRDYVELMAHFDAVLPGRVHRVIYERMVDDTETEIRRLLDYCGLAFDERCLRFHETDRAVRTPSSEQVRRPIFRDAVEQWRHYAPWLGPLEAALGDVVEAYPDAPHFPGRPERA